MSEKFSVPASIVTKIVELDNDKVELYANGVKVIAYKRQFTDYEAYKKQVVEKNSNQ